MKKRQAIKRIKKYGEWVEKYGRYYFSIEDCFRKRPHILVKAWKAMDKKYKIPLPPGINKESVFIRPPGWWA